MMTDLMGYAHPNYALSLQEFGEPRELPRCGGWILVRPIPNTPYKDAMGCYPIFACWDWSRLHEDLEEVGADLVSLVLVTDPFAAVWLDYLERHFQIAKSFKSHYVVDLTYEREQFVGKHHRYYARKSLREMKVEICEKSVRYLDEWCRLYDELIRRYQISGIRAFSKVSFSQQLQIPGNILLVGKLCEQIIGGHIIVIQGDVSFSHLAALSDAGYKCYASYGLCWESMGYLKEHGVRYFDLGAAAGIEGDVRDGL